MNEAQRLGGNYQCKQQVLEGGCIRAILYAEGDTRVTEGQPVDNHEIAQTQSDRMSIYLMQYPPLKVRHTSC